jgi:hypothetical protein
MADKMCLAIPVDFEGIRSINIFLLYTCSLVHLFTLFCRYLK